MKRKYRRITGILLAALCLLSGCIQKEKEELLLVPVSEEASKEEGYETILADAGILTDSEAEKAAAAGAERTADTGAERTADTGAAEENSELVIYICGAVKSPGVYTLAQGSRLYQAVEAAGGFLEEAGEEYLNLADLLSDGEKVYVPSEEEAKAQLLSKEGTGSALTKEVNDGKININTAPSEMLCTLPGIGEGKAKSIITYREANGSFKSTEEIMNVEGIKDGLFQKIKDMITV